MKGDTIMADPNNPVPLAPSVKTGPVPLAPSAGGPAPLAPAAAAEQPKTFWGKYQRWFFIGVGIIVGLSGINKIYKAFTPQLPGCAAQATADVIRDIFKSKNVAITVLNDMRTVSETSSLQSCQAHIETAAETGTISYNITLQGSNFQVLITNVDAHNR